MQPEFSRAHTRILRVFTNCVNIPASGLIHEVFQMSHIRNCFALHALPVFTAARGVTAHGAWDCFDTLYSPSSSPRDNTAPHRCPMRGNAAQH
jgi:hypothetical protein